MFGFLSKKKRVAAPGPATGGRLVYAVGDIHGHLDLLDRLLLDITHNILAAPPAERPALVFVGDYIDRGPDSKGVIDRMIALEASDAFECRFLKGNHEVSMMTFLEDPGHGPIWAEFGGVETLRSYGVTPPALRSDPKAWIAVRDAFAEAVPDEHLRFLARLELMAVYGDYVFVHAGLRPDTPLDRQTEQDLLWIRQEFLTAQRPFEKVVVHGHTPEEKPYLGPIRIGLDTGAYATGVLTAVRLQDETRVFLQSRSERLGAAAPPVERAPAAAH